MLIAPASLGTHYIRCTSYPQRPSPPACPYYVWATILSSVHLVLNLAPTTSPTYIMFPYSSDDPYHFSLSPRPSFYHLSLYFFLCGRLVTWQPVILVLDSYLAPLFLILASPGASRTNAATVPRRLSVLCSEVSPLSTFSVAICFARTDLLHPIVAFSLTQC